MFPKILSAKILKILIFKKVKTCSKKQIPILLLKQLSLDNKQWRINYLQDHLPQKANNLSIF